jgi:hypothetical protein
LGRVILTGGLIRRGRNLTPYYYVAVTPGLIHRMGIDGANGCDLGSPLCRGDEIVSDLFAIDHKSGALRYLVVELHSGVICLMC